MRPLMILAYGIVAGSMQRFDVSVEFDGYVPILGGRESKAKVEFLVRVDGQEAPEKKLQALSTIEKFRMSLDGAELPFTEKNIQGFFPPTTVVATRSGKVETTDAPKTKLPVRLPGLDSQKFPDITYLPLEFPAAEVKLNIPFTFEKAFNGSQALYTVTPTKILEERVEMVLKIAQTVVGYEDQTGNSLEAEGPGSRRVESTITGDGTATFDRKTRSVTLAKIRAVSVDKVFPTGKEPYERRLVTILTIKQQKPE